MKARLACLVLACAALAGCAGSSTASYYHKHRRELMHEVVRCENNGGALANTPHCREVLRLNSQLF
jgi:hypothetical protein